MGIGDTVMYVCMYVCMYVSIKRQSAMVCGLTDLVTVASDRTLLGLMPMSQEIRSGHIPIRPRVNFISRFDPSLRKRSVFGPSIPSRKSLAVRMTYDFSTLLEHCTLFRTFMTHGNRLLDERSVQQEWRHV